ncbi:MAG: sodium:solute symporter family protein [Nitrospinota bacterium]
MLAPIDWGLIAGFLLFALLVGIWVSRSASRSLVSYFLAGRSLPWWWLGTSMVATTFASDTPLVVAGIVGTRGISGNWFWWSWILGTVGVAVFFAPLWRRLGVVTDAEFIERRYDGRVATGLRVFKAIYSSLIVNLIVLGWVFRAMGKIAAAFLRWEEIFPAPIWTAIETLWPRALVLGTVNESFTVVALVILVGIYSSAGGIRGVILTDLFQFGIALFGSFLFAWIAVAEVGGLSSLVAKLQETYGPAGAAEFLSFVPPQGAEWAGAQVIFIYLFVAWWAQHHADGGGYIAQRLCTAATPRDAQAGALWFAIAHYVIRPWPWILIGLVGLVLFPKGMEAPAGSLAAQVVADREAAYPILMAKLLPAGLLGLVLVGMLGAFMSTVDTHLNWGASYLINDLYVRFFRPGAGRREVIAASRIGVVLMVVGSLAVAAQIGSIERAWKFNIALGAGLGLPVLLRWLWWRANAWTEIAGMLAAGLTAVVLHWRGDPPPFPILLSAEVSIGAVAMLIATYLTRPVQADTLRRFYREALPPGAWRPFREVGVPAPRAFHLVAQWVLLSAAIFGGMLLLGSVLVGKPADAIFYALLLLGSLAVLCLMRIKR